MCKSNYIHYYVWDNITYPFPYPNDATADVFGMDTLFHPTLYWACDYLSMLGLRLIHVSERGPEHSTLFDAVLEHNVRNRNADPHISYLLVLDMHGIWKDVFHYRTD